MLFSSYNNNKIKIWDVLTEKKIGQETGMHKEAIKTLSFSYDGSTLVSAGKDGIITLWG
jgi:WD40 repeat protein